MRWTLEDIAAGDPGDNTYLTLSPFDNGASWNFLRHYFPKLLGTDLTGTPQGIPEWIPPGWYELEGGGAIEITDDDLVLADVFPAGRMLPGEKRDQKRTFYYELLLQYRHGETYDPADEALEDPEKWHIPGGDARFCPGGGESGGGGASGGTTGATPGICPPGSGGWKTIYSYNESNGQQWVYAPYFSQAVAAQWSEWERDGDMMRTALSGYASGDSTVSSRIFNEVKAAGYAWYQEGITEDPLAEFYYKFGPIWIYPEGHFYYARTCALPGMEAKDPIPGGGLPPLWPTITIPFLKEIKPLAKAARIGVDLRPYDAMLIGKKLTFALNETEEQITINAPEGEGGESGGGGASGDW